MNYEQSRLADIERLNEAVKAIRRPPPYYQREDGSPVGTLRLRKAYGDDDGVGDWSGPEEVFRLAVALINDADMLLELARSAIEQRPSKANDGDGNGQ